MTTEKYKPQLNFVNEMALSKKGIIDEISHCYDDNLRLWKR